MISRGYTPCFDLSHSILVLTALFSQKFLLLISNHWQNIYSSLYLLIFWPKILHIYGLIFVGYFLYKLSAPLNDDVIADSQFSHTASLWMDLMRCLFQFEVGWSWGWTLSLEFSVNLLIFFHFCHHWSGLWFLILRVVRNPCSATTGHVCGFSSYGQCVILLRRLKPPSPSYRDSKDRFQPGTPIFVF